jgi:hypothetical protein
LATRLSKQPPDKSALSATLLREVRIGINIVELRRVQRQVSKPARLAINHAVQHLPLFHCAGRGRRARKQPLTWIMTPPARTTPPKTSAPFCCASL